MDRLEGERAAERGGKWFGSGGSGVGGGRLSMPAGAVGCRGEALAIANQGLGDNILFPKVVKLAKLVSYGFNKNVI